MRRHRAIWLRSGAIVTTVVAAIVVLALTGDARATPYGEVYLQFNLCGNVCGNGGLRVVANLENSIYQRRPFAVTLNEVCENQYDALRADLVRYDGRFDPTGPRCRNGARYGNAVLMRAPDVNLVGSWDLPNPARAEPRRLMCLGTHNAGTLSLVVCVTHISNVSRNIAPQVTAVAGIVNGLDANNAVLLGGDFNTDPGDARMNPLYGACYSSGAGAFHEADSAGCASRDAINNDVGSDLLNEDTFAGRKFDYIFLSAADWSSSEADATGEANALSDHDPLWATAIV